MYSLKCHTGLFLLILLFFCSCQGKIPVENPNIVIITLDTTRADHLECYGYDLAETPNLDALAKTGVLFRQAYAPAPITLPSHVSIMTGLYPYAHGVRLNGLYHAPENLKTLAEVFQERGYRTGAFIGAFPLDSQFGLDQGFEVYNQDYDLKGGTGGFYYDERRAEKVIASARKWLKQNRKDPFFLWVHLFDPHAAYDPPEPYQSRFHERLYDGEIAYMDASLKPLLNDISQEDLKDKTLICLTADHGEGLGEHGEMTHAFFTYNSTLHVPLVFSAPWMISPGTIVQAPVSLVDIYPTLLELAGIKQKENLQGVSLVKAFNNPSFNRPPLYFETQYGMLQYGWAELCAIRSEDWKYICAPEEELYYLPSDPGERHNLWKVKPEIAQDLKAQLEQMRKSSSYSEIAGSQHEIDEKTRQRLRKLGYLGNIPAPPATPDKAWIHHQGPDPKLVIAAFSYIELGVFHADQKNYSSALPFFEEALEIDPGNSFALQQKAFCQSQLGNLQEAQSTLIGGISGSVGSQLYGNLGYLYFLNGQFDKAEEAYRKAIKGDPEQAMHYHNLALIQFLLNRWDEAKENLEKALRINPRMIEALASMARWHLEHQQPGKALQFVQRALEVSDQRSEIHLMAAECQAKAGHIPETEDHLIQALTLDPLQIQASRILHSLYQSMGEIKRGKQTFEKLLESNPESVAGHYGLALSLVDEGDEESAIAQYRKILEMAPSQEQFRLDIAMLLGRLKNYEQELQELEIALRIFPDNPECYIGLGAGHLGLNQIPEASKALDQALELAPEHPEAWYHKARLEARKGDPAAAKTALAKAIQWGGNTYRKRAAEDLSLKNFLGESSKN